MDSVDRRTGCTEGMINFCFLVMTVFGIVILPKLGVYAGHMKPSMRALGAGRLLLGLFIYLGGLGAALICYFKHFGNKYVMLAVIVLFSAFLLYLEVQHNITRPIPMH